MLVLALAKSASAMMMLMTSSTMMIHRATFDGRPTTMPRIRSDYADDQWHDRDREEQRSGGIDERIAELGLVVAVSGDVVQRGVPCSEDVDADRDRRRCEQDDQDGLEDDDDLRDRQPEGSLVHLDHDRLRHRLRDVLLGHLARIRTARGVGALGGPAGCGPPGGGTPGGCGGRLPGGWGGSAATIALLLEWRPSRTASRLPDSRLCGPRMCWRSCRASLACGRRTRPI